MIGRIIWIVIINEFGQLVSKILILIYLFSNQICFLGLDPISPYADQQYGFNDFTVTLNQLTNEMIPFLPPTDTRFRPDQR